MKTSSQLLFDSDLHDPKVNTALIYDFDLECTTATVSSAGYSVCVVLSEKIVLFFKYLLELQFYLCY